MKDITIKIKTLEDCTGNFSEDFKVGDRVDEEIINYFLWLFPPVTITKKIIQTSEIFGHDEKDGNIYMTFEHDGISWIYKGLCFKNRVTNIKINGGCKNE